MSIVRPDGPTRNATRNGTRFACDRLACRHAARHLGNPRGSRGTIAHRPAFSCILWSPRPGGRGAYEDTMSAFAVRIASLAIALGAPAATALAESPPNLNVATSCEAAARGAIVAGRDREACMG